MKRQLKEALVEAAEKPNPRANSSSEAGDVQASPPPMVAEAEVTHLKKFGKLLATFGTRTACLLRHLGPECSPLERRKAFIILAKVRRREFAEGRRHPKFQSAHWGV